MLTNYLVYESIFDITRPWTCDDFRTASIMANEFEREGKSPFIYKLVYADGEMQNVKK